MILAERLPSEGDCRSAICHPTTTLAVTPTLLWLWYPGGRKTHIRRPSHLISKPSKASRRLGCICVVLLRILYSGIDVLR
jgi:hypothetical protein